MNQIGPGEKGERGRGSVHIPPQRDDGARGVIGDRCLGRAGPPPGVPSPARGATLLPGPLALWASRGCEARPARKASQGTQPGCWGPEPARRVSASGSFLAALRRTAPAPGDADATRETREGGRVLRGRGGGGGTTPRVES